MLLGDGSLSKPPKGVNYHFAVYHSSKQLEYLHWKDRFLQPYSHGVRLCCYLDKRDGKSRSGGRLHTISLPYFSQLRELFYPSGRKIISSEMLHLISHPVALAFLVGDDGSFSGCSNLEIATKQFSESENLLVVDWLQSAYGLTAYLKQGPKYTWVAIRAVSFQRLRDLTIPWLPKSMIYKLGGKDWKPSTRCVGKTWVNCSQCGRAFEAYAKSKRKVCSRSCSDLSKLGKPGHWKGKKRPEMNHPGKHLFQKKMLA